MARLRARDQAPYRSGLANEKPRVLALIQKTVRTVA